MQHILALQITNEDPRQKLVITLINPPKSLTQRKAITTQPKEWTLPVGISHICLCSDWMRPNSGKDLKLRLTIKSIHEESNSLYSNIFGPKSTKKYLKPKGLVIDKLGRKTLILEAVNSKKNQHLKKRADPTIVQTKTEETNLKKHKITDIELEFINEITKAKLGTCMKNEKHAELEDRIIRVKFERQREKRNIYVASLQKMQRDDKIQHVPQQADKVQRTADPIMTPVAVL